MKIEEEMYLRNNKLTVSYTKESRVIRKIEDVKVFRETYMK